MESGQTLVSPHIIAIAPLFSYTSISRALLPLYTLNLYRHFSMPSSPYFGFLSSSLPISCSIHPCLPAPFLTSMWHTWPRNHQLATVASAVRISDLYKISNFSDFYFSQIKFNPFIFNNIIPWFNIQYLYIVCFVYITNKMFVLFFFA